MKPKTFLSAIVLIGNVSCALSTDTDSQIDDYDFLKEFDFVESFAVEEDTIDNENLKSVLELEQPVPRAQNGNLVFVKHFGDGKSDICTISMETEGDEPRPMRINENDLFMDEDKTAYILFYPPKFSPDRSKIVFSREDFKRRVVIIYTIDQDGQNLRKITKGKYPCFSPDGQRIVATDKLSQIFTCDLNGGDKKILIPKKTNARCEDSISRINFTPDGKGIYFIQYNSITRSNDLKIADAVTGEIIKIVKDVKSASFSPDGKYIVFSNWNRKMCIMDVESETVFEDLSAEKFDKNFRG